MSLLTPSAEAREGGAVMPDPDEVRKQWARRVTEEYDGWPDWSTPDAPDDPGTRESGREEERTRADLEAGRAGSGFAWGVGPEELEDLDPQLTLRQHTGETARALREERAHWGLDAADG